MKKKGFRLWLLTGSGERGRQRCCRLDTDDVAVWRSSERCGFTVQDRPVARAWASRASGRPGFGFGGVGVPGQGRGHGRRRGLGELAVRWDEGRRRGRGGCRGLGGMVKLRGVAEVRARRGRVGARCRARLEGEVGAVDAACSSAWRGPWATSWTELGEGRMRPSRLWRLARTRLRA